MPSGITVKQGSGGSRVEIQCKHQNGLLYVVPAEASWVCAEETVPAHAIAGFLKDLSQWGNPQVQGLMQKWGIYFRARPLDEPDGASSGG